MAAVNYRSDHTTVLWHDPLKFLWVGDSMVTVCPGSEAKAGKLQPAAGDTSSDFISASPEVHFRVVNHVQLALRFTPQASALSTPNLCLPFIIY